ncbi:uncharacterized protein Z519_00863 [Cladophialophora bantiana CBS 173.52]|uniref:Uncharacterized protein n=1 Tax=Cladophialophora bantiana (strain ATCC 10958 / CBS 173.52 / CDC B-1940 / NIH 8579) TaxID=1442370 RepID=A0A0D2I7G1_CLAB1|nr:uncharacterized protein Z519_00863 [Cladophialophora bantiana CBS 173.52]KIW99200.1 hypothetical protein Z519_00863 [Cladophialophora bantiana CBS 173.52]
MSSPPSELSWVSSSELNELESAVDVQAKLTVWQNNWTPINPPSEPVAAALPSRSSSQSDIDDSEGFSPFASHVRERILCSALRIKERLRATKKRKAPTPPSSRKRLATSSSEYAQHSVMLPDEKQNLSAKAFGADELSSPLRHETHESLLPIGLNKLNIAAAGRKRTSSETFAADTEDLPVKKALVMRSAAKGAVPVAADASSKDNQDEDLFNDDSIDIENFLEAERALAAKTTHPYPTATSAQRLEPYKSPEKAPSAMKAISTAWTPKASMKPLVRSFLPPSRSSVATSSTGPLAVFSPLYPLPICFRIAEARRYVSFTFSSLGPTAPAQTEASNETSSNPMFLGLHIYAILHSTQDTGTIGTVTLADMFFPDQPPYLTGALVPQATSAMTRSAPSPRSLPNVGSVVRATVRISQRSTFDALAALTTNALVPSSSSSPGVHKTFLPAAAAGKYSVTFLRIDPSDWNEIQRVKTFLEQASSAMTPAQSIPLKQSMTGSDNGQMAESARRKTVL